MDGSVSIHHRNIQKVATEMFKAKSNLSPELTQSIFQRNEVLNLRSDNTFLRPKVNTVYNGEGSLRSFGPIVWNNLLPNKYKSAENLEIFKNKIKLWVPENCPCRLCKDICRYLFTHGFCGTSKAPWSFFYSRSKIINDTNIFIRLLLTVVVE